MKPSTLLVLLLIELASCDSNAPPLDTTADPILGYSVELEETEIGVSGSGAPVSACFLANYYKGGAGTFKVTKLVGVTEPGTGGHPDGFTYVTLELQKGWVADTPADVVLRISGGPVGPDVWASGPVHLELHEVAGFVLWEPREVNNGYYSVAPTALFQDRGGYFDSQAGLNKQYGKLTLDEIGALIASEAGKDDEECPPAEVAPSAPGAPKGEPPIEVE